MPDPRRRATKGRTRAAPKRAGAKTSSAPRKPGAPTSRQSKRGKVRAGGAPASDPAPDILDVDRPPPGLPELTFPGSSLESADPKASHRRNQRLRTEIIGGALLGAMGIGAALALKTPAFLLLTLLVVGGIVAYEFLVTSLE